MSATMTKLLSSGEFCKLRYDTIPVKSASANVSIPITQKCQILSCDTCRRWAICTVSVIVKTWIININVNKSLFNMTIIKFQYNIQFPFKHLRHFFSPLVWMHSLLVWLGCMLCQWTQWVSLENIHLNTNIIQSTQFLMVLCSFCGFVIVNISKMAARKGLHLDLEFVGNELHSTGVV